MGLILLRVRVNKLSLMAMVLMIVAVTHCTTATLLLISVVDRYAAVVGTVDRY